MKPQSRLLASVAVGIALASIAVWSATSTVTGYAAGLAQRQGQPAVTQVRSTQSIRYASGAEDESATWLLDLRSRLLQVLSDDPRSTSSVALSNLCEQLSSLSSMLDDMPLGSTDGTDGSAQTYPGTQAVPQFSPPTRAPSDSPPSSSSQQAVFRLCPTDDPHAMDQISRSLEQLIAGRGVRMSLVGRPDGCADLTVSVPATPAGAASSARQSTSLSVSAGQQTIRIQVVSENGATRVTIGVVR